MPRPRSFAAMIAALPALAVCLAVCLAACSGGGARGAVGSAPGPAAHSLAGIAAQPVAVLPTYAVRIMPDFTLSIDRPAAIERQMDADIVAAMEERGLDRRWIFPQQLAETARHNSTYATDPYAFDEEPLRSPQLNSEKPLPEPLASQLRTLVALQQDARAVLAPVELRLEKTGTTNRAVLHLVLIDARSAQMIWKGDIPSDTISAWGPAVTASIAARLAGVVAPQ